MWLNLLKKQFRKQKNTTPCGVFLLLSSFLLEYERFFEHYCKWLKKKQTTEGEKNHAKGEI